MEKKIAAAIAPAVTAVPRSDNRRKANRLPSLGRRFVSGEIAINFAEMNQHAVRKYAGQDAVQERDEIGSAYLDMTARGAQRTQGCFVFGAGKGKSVEQAGFVCPDGLRNELCIPDPVGADCRDADSLRAEFDTKRPAVAEKKGFCGGINGQIRDGLKSGAGTDLKNMASCGHKGQRQLGHGHGCPAVEINHAGQIHQIDVRRNSDEAETCGVDKPANLQSGRLGELLLNRGENRFLCEITGKNTAWNRAELLCQRFQMIPAAGDEPELIQCFFCGKQAGIFASEPTGSAGNDRDVHGMMILQVK